MSEPPILAERPPPPDPFGREIGDVLNGGAHLLAWLAPDHPPFGSFVDGSWIKTPMPVAFEHYHPKGAPLPNGRVSALYDLWLGCREIEALRVARTGAVGQPVVSGAPVDPSEPVGPDEAPAPLDRAPVEQQPRLNGLG